MSSTTTDPTPVQDPGDNLSPARLRPKLTPAQADFIGFVLTMSYTALLVWAVEPVF